MRTSGLPGAFAILLTVACVLASATAVRASLEVVGPREVEERFVVRYGSNAYLVVGDRQWELVTNPRSPLVSPLGDGSFHPMNPDLVTDALRELEFVPGRVDGRVFILPYPRRSTLQSSCEGGTIFLSPGIREVSAEHVHATVVHEVGHLVQRQHAPEGSRAWSEYVERRGLDHPRFHPHASHRDRPREIFAEDFRFLFGGALSTSAGTIENPDLPLPTRIAGLTEWFRRVLRSRETALFEAALPPPTISPNPYPAAVGAVRVRFHAPPGRGGSHADVFDLTGRRVRTITGSTTLPASVEFTWNGRDTRGRRVASGLYFVRWRENAAAGTARVQILR